MRRTMATAVDSGCGAVSHMTSMESSTSDPVGGTASVTVDELVAVLAQRQSTEEESAMLAPWFVSAVDERGAEMIDAGNDSSVVGRERGGEDDRPRQRRGELQCARRQRTRESSVRRAMATALYSGCGAMSDMTSMESSRSGPVGRPASDTVDELVAVLAQRRSTEEENAVPAPWYRQYNGRDRGGRDDRYRK